MGNLLSEELIASIVGAKGFGRSDRRRALFTYLANATIRGGIEDVTEHAIAYDVFERGEDFDPMIDSSVRAEMHRLRNRLKIVTVELDDVEVFIPNGSYSVVVKPLVEEALETKTKPKSYMEKLWKWGLAGIALFALAIGLTVFPRSTQIETFRPHLHVIVSGGSERAVFIEQRVIDTLSRDNMLFLTTAKDAEYTLEITENPGHEFFQIQLLNTKGQLLAVKSISNSKDTVEETAAEILWSLRYDFIQSPDAQLPKNYMSSNDVDFRRQDSYKCLTAVESKVGSVNKSKYSNIEMIKCLEKARLTKHSADRARIGLSLAMLNMQQARGYQDYGVADPLVNAAQLNDEALRVLGADRSVLVNQIYYYWAAGVRAQDEEKFEAILDQAISRYGDDVIIQYMAAMSYALYLNDWVDVETILYPHLELFREKDVGMNALVMLPLTQGVMNKDSKEIEFWLKRVNLESGLPYSATALSAVCLIPNGVSRNYKKTVIDQLVKDQINSYHNFEQVLLKFNYHPDVNANLLASLEGCETLRALETHSGQAVP